MMNGAPQRVVIIGNGMVSHRLCTRLAQEPSIKITVVGEEPRAAYDRVHLTSFFSGSSPEDLLLSPTQWYGENGIDLHLGSKATWIDRSRQIVVSENGVETPYDRLVIATGSKPFAPPIPGGDLPNVFLYRTIEDVQRIREAAGNASKAAVMGGGLLGLEAAKALYDMGLETHVLEVAPALMPRQLDAGGGRLLKRKIESLGVHVRLLHRTKEIQPAEAGDGLRLCFDGRDPLDVDMLVISAGIRPRAELAEAVGLDLGERGGVRINDHCQTSDYKIYAVGECAEHRGVVYGLVGPCYQMADVVANNLLNHETRFEGADLAATLKLLGVEVTTIGRTLGESEGGAIRTFEDEEVCRKLIVEDRRIVGGMAVGPWPELNEVRDAVENNRRLWPWQLRRFQETGELFSGKDPLPVAQWPDSATICSCLGVSKSELVAAVDAGADSSVALASQTGASTVCGSCKPLLAELCGQSRETVVSKGSRSLLWISALSAALAVIVSLAPSQAAATTVTGAWHTIDYIWRDSVCKQISGFSLAGVMTLSLVFSLRKRIRFFSWGEYGSWRVAHAVVGGGTLIGFIVHTGMSLGQNLNFCLAVAFLFVVLLGGVTGAATSLESKLTGPSALLVRRWRPRLTNLHIWVFWPIPVLLLFHVIAVYYF